MRLVSVQWCSRPLAVKTVSNSNETPHYAIMSFVHKFRELLFGAACLSRIPMFWSRACAIVEAERDAGNIYLTNFGNDRTKYLQVIPRMKKVKLKCTINFSLRSVSSRLLLHDTCSPSYFILTTNILTLGIVSSRLLLHFMKLLLSYHIKFVRVLGFMIAYDIWAWG